MSEELIRRTADGDWRVSLGEIVVGRVYTWKEWSMVKKPVQYGDLPIRYCLYIWSKSSDIALEMSESSNGFFRFIAQDHLYTMSVGGQKESGSLSSTIEILRKIHESKELHVLPNARPDIVIFPQTSKHLQISFGNWIIRSDSDGVLSFNNKWCLGEGVGLDDGGEMFLYSAGHDEGVLIFYG